jgi:hypothetical protein
VPTTVAALEVAVGADISGADKGLSTLNKRLGTLPGFFGNAASSALGFGAATIGLNALGGVGDLVHEALGVGLASDLEGLTAQFAAFTGSGDQASSILASVRKEADLTPFGFQELASAAATLLPAAKQSGTALFDLIHPAEILAALNPEQGLTGAAFALREALSGDFVSIVDRFNLPRDRINTLRKEGVPALQAISMALAEMGADMNLVTLRAQTTAGRLSTFQDQLSSIEIQAGKPILAALGGELDRFSGIITSGQGGLEGFATSLGTTIAGGIHTAGQELGTFLVTMQNISAEHGVDTLTAAFITLENRIGEVFGAQAQTDTHKFLTDLRTDSQWFIDNTPRMFADVGAGIHNVIDAADRLTRLLNTIESAGPAARAALAKLFGVEGQPTIANRVATGEGSGLGSPGGPGSVVSGEAVNAPGIPGNLFPGGPIFAGPGAPATNVTVNVTGNNIDNQVDVDAMAQQLAAAVADGQRSAANAPPNTLVAAA